MSQFRRFSILTLAAVTTFAQSSEVSIQNPAGYKYVGRLAAPFHSQQRIVAPPKMTNSPRLDSLIRAGNLYLTAQDVIALALENNLDIAIQRYGPYLQQEVLRRAEGGAPLRQVGVPVSAGPVSVSTTGVSALSVGLAGGGSGVTSGGGLVASIGSPTPSLDPTLFAFAQFSHTTTPLQNTTVALVPTQVSSSQVYQIQYSQSWVTGTTAQMTYFTGHVGVNSPVYALNPYRQGDLELYITQPLLQGGRRPVNNRYIRIARNNIKVSEITLKLQVITTVSAILNLYWDLVSFNDDARIKQKALETAQQLYEDNKHQADLGTLPAIEVTRAEAQVSQSKEDLLIAQTNVLQQEVVLKNALSRTGIADPSLDEVHIVPLDSIIVPQQEQVQPVSDLAAEALAKRPEIEQGKINIESDKIQSLGTRNALLPNVQAFLDLSNSGLSGSANPLCASLPPAEQFVCTPDPYNVGGLGNFFGQVFRRNYPNYSAGFSVNIPFRNRAAQADYVTDQLTLHRDELGLQKVVNQVRQDVRNAMVGLQQARARYEASVATRKLAEQTLEAEQMRFKFGESSIPTVVQAQRDLANDQSAEIQAMANYTHSRIAFDQALGATLDVNHISMDEAISGSVARPSSLPASAPAKPEVKR
ncbi:MAG: TolC family protein [Acidobacteriia bacterium]|nr:TolC family protein [Terriglobia bacterium]